VRIKQIVSTFLPSLVFFSSKLHSRGKTNARILWYMIQAVLYLLDLADALSRALAPQLVESRAGETPINKVLESLGLTDAKTLYYSENDSAWEDVVSRRDMLDSLPQKTYISTPMRFMVWEGGGLLELLGPDVRGEMLDLNPYKELLFDLMEDPYPCTIKTVNVLGQISDNGIGLPIASHGSGQKWYLSAQSTDVDNPLNLNEIEYLVSGLREPEGWAFKTTSRVDGPAVSVDDMKIWSTVLRSVVQAELPFGVTLRLSATQKVNISYNAGGIAFTFQNGDECVLQSKMGIVFLHRFLKDVQQKFQGRTMREWFQASFRSPFVLWKRLAPRGIAFGQSPDNDIADALGYKRTRPGNKVEFQSLSVFLEQKAPKMKPDTDMILYSPVGLLLLRRVDADKNLYVRQLQSCLNENKDNRKMTWRARNEREAGLLFFYLLTQRTPDTILHGREVIDMEKIQKPENESAMEALTARWVGGENVPGFCGFETECPFFGPNKNTLFMTKEQRPLMQQIIIANALADRPSNFVIHLGDDKYSAIATTKLKGYASLAMWGLDSKHDTVECAAASPIPPLGPLSMTLNLMCLEVEDPKALPIERLETGFERLVFETKPQFPAITAEGGEIPEIDPVFASELQSPRNKVGVPDWQTVEVRGAPFPTRNAQAL